MSRRRSHRLLVVLFALAIAPAAHAQVPDLTVPAARDTEPVVLTGKDLAGWAAPNETTVRLPLWDYVECPGGIDPSAFNDPTNDGVDGAVAGLDMSCPDGVDEHSHY